MSLQANSSSHLIQYWRSDVDPTHFLRRINYIAVRRKNTLAPQQKWKDGTTWLINHSHARQFKRNMSETMHKQEKYVTIISTRAFQSATRDTSMKIQALKQDLHITIHRCQWIVTNVRSRHSTRPSTWNNENRIKSVKSSIDVQYKKSRMRQARIRLQCTANQYKYV